MRNGIKNRNPIDIIARERTQDKNERVRGILKTLRRVSSRSVIDTVRSRETPPETLSDVLDVVVGNVRHRNAMIKVEADILGQ